MHIFRDGLLSGRTAVVTGAARGLGKEIATALASYGAHVAFHGRKPPENLAAEHGGIALGADLTSPSAGAHLVDAAVARLGRIDILVNCAAGRTDGRDVVPGEDGPAELYRPVIVDAARDAAWAAFRHGARYIVNIGSIAGFAASEADGYAVAKSELHDLTRQLAREMAPNTLVNCIAPGPVEAGGGLLLSEAEREEYCAEIPLRRLATADDVTHAVIYLVSGGADYLTGQVISLTGGWVMRG